MQCIKFIIHQKNQRKALNHLELLCGCLTRIMLRCIKSQLATFLEKKKREKTLKPLCFSELSHFVILQGSRMTEDEKNIAFFELLRRYVYVFYFQDNCSDYRD